jgi:hypothetical protein
MTTAREQEQIAILFLESKAQRHQVCENSDLNAVVVMQMHTPNGYVVPELTAPGGKRQHMPGFVHNDLSESNFLLLHDSKGWPVAVMMSDTDTIIPVGTLPLDLKLKAYLRQHSGADPAAIWHGNRSSVSLEPRLGQTYISFCRRPWHLCGVAQHPLSKQDVCFL